MTLKNILIPIIAVLAFANADAKTASWSVPPKYEKLIRIHDNIVAFSQNSNWGLIKIGSGEILPASNGFLKPFTNGYALAGVNEWNRHLLKYIIDTDGNITTIANKLYLPETCRYVSEGKLAVMDKIGKYGYITTDGLLIIKCQFADALPFKERVAPVKSGKFYKYISDSYDNNPAASTLTVNFKYGELTRASCFSNGNAAVANYNNYALINRSGNVIKKLSKSDFYKILNNNNVPSIKSNYSVSESNKYTPFAEGDKYGLKLGDSIILKPQFDSFADQFSDELIIATMNGRQGILKINDDNIDVSIYANNANSDRIEVDRKGNFSQITLTAGVPQSLSDVRVYLDAGNQSFQDITSQMTDQNVSMTYSFTPAINDDDEVCCIKGRIESDGIILKEFEKQFSVDRPIKLRLSQPGPANIRADHNDQACFSVTIYNDSNKDVTTSATWSTNKTVSVRIPAHSSRTISDCITVIKPMSQTIGVKLGTGEYSQRLINFEPF